MKFFEYNNTIIPYKNIIAINIKPYPYVPYYFGGEGLIKWDLEMLLSNGKTLRYVIDIKDGKSADEYLYEWKSYWEEIQ